MRKNALATTWILRSLLLVVAAMLAATNSYAQDGVLKDDAYTQTSTPNQNFGANANLRVASGVNSYLRFDLSTLPAGTVGSDVAKATLRLYVNTLTTAGSFDVDRVTGAWDEGTITGNSVPSLGGSEVTGIGVPAGSVDSFVTVDITALVKDWLDGVIANNGIALLPNAAGISVRFDSKENGSTSHEPRLEITLRGLEGPTGPQGPAGPQGPQGPPGSGTVTSVSGSAPLSVTNPTTTPNISLGLVPIPNGGTGLSSSGPSGNFLRSNGSIWASAALQPSDIPAGSSSYVQNTTAQQLGSNFNISGNGTVGGNLFATGNVGIGTTSPTSRLEVAGRVFGSGVADVRFASIHDNSENAIAGVEGYGAGGSSVGGFILAAGRGTSKHLTGIADDDPYLAIRGSSKSFHIGFGSPFMTVRGDSGNVGIGSTNPVQKLDVTGNIKINGTGNGLIFADGSVQTTASGSGSGAATNLNCIGCVSVAELDFDPATQGEIDAHKSSGDHDSRYALIAHTHNVSEVNNAATLGANLFVGNQTVDGSVGIGAPNPAERLTVASASNPTIEVVPLAGGQTSGLRVYNANTRGFQGFFLLLDAAGELRTGNNVSWPYTFYTNGSERMRITQTGNVGIGTADPAERLTVTGASNPTIEVVPSAGGQTSGLKVYNANSRAFQGFFVLDDAVGELRTGNNVAWPYTFRTNGSEQMRITQTGNVGIGTTSPQAKLHVIGDFVATGTKSAVVTLPDKRVVSLYAVESPENWFEDFGSATLTGGVAQVALDSTFSQTVNTDMTYHVFLTPNGNSQGLYVARKSAGGFEVREQGDGKSNVAFDYRIVARRRGYEDLRLREVRSDSAAATATNRQIP